MATADSSRAARFTLAFLLMLPVLGRTQPEGDAGPRVTIEVAVFEGGEGLNFYLDCARDYEQIKPGITVNLYGDPRIDDKMRVRILEGSHPEATNAYNIDYWTLIRNGDIMPLDEFLDDPNWEGDGIWRDSFFPGSLDRFVWEGKTYAIPYLYSAFVTWYNKRMFEEHGWRPARTWDEFLALCEQIKRANIPPLAFQGRYTGYIQALINSTYYHLAGPEGFLAQQYLRPGSFNNPEAIQALTLVQRVALEYFQPGAIGMSHTEAQLQFFTSNTAMIFCGAWLKSEMIGKIPEGFRLGAFNLPIIDNGIGDPTAVSVGAGNYFVFQNSHHPREMVDFLRFMTSREQAGKFCRERDMICAIRGSADGNVSTDVQDLVDLVNKAQSVVPGIPGEGFPEMAQHWADAQFALLTGKKKPAEIAADLESAALAVRTRMEDPDRITVRHRWKPLFLVLLIAAAILYWTVSSVRKFRAARTAGGPAIISTRLRLNLPTAAIFVTPALLLYSLFVVLPSLKSLTWSLYKWNGLTEMTFKGLLHFKRLLLESDIFWTALDNNLFIMFVIPLFVLPLSLLLAASISRGVRGATVFRTVLFFPNIVGAVAATILWMHMYNPQGGVVNEALVGLGSAASSVGLSAIGASLQSFAGFAWLSPDHLYWALVPMSIWGACGFNMLLFLAAMEGIPPSYYEAAELDGASKWSQFWSITVPFIWEVLAIAIVFMIIGGMKAFEAIWLLTNQQPITQTHVIGTLMVQTMFQQFRVGEATAIAVLLFLMVFFGTLATMRMMRRETVEY